MNENYEGALAKIDAARKLARQTMAKHGKEEVCDPPMGIDTPQRPALPAWQDVLGAAEQLVRQKPAFPKYIKGTVLENDVPVWIATSPSKCWCASCLASGLSSLPTAVTVIPTTQREPTPPEPSTSPPLTSGDPIHTTIRG